MINPIHIKPSHSWFENKKLSIDSDGERRWQTIDHNEIITRYDPTENEFNCADFRLCFEFLSTEMYYKNSYNNIFLQILKTPIKQNMKIDDGHEPPLTYEDLFNIIGERYDMITVTENNTTRKIKSYPDSCGLRLEFVDGVLSYGYHR